MARGNSSGSGSGSGGGGGGGSPSSASSSCILLVNNGALPSFSEGKADPETGDVLILWLKKTGGGGNGGWERVEPSSLLPPSSSPPPPLLRGAGGEERAGLFVQAVAKGLIDQVHDFDDHLLDLKNDWLNPGLLG